MADTSLHLCCNLHYKTKMADRLIKKKKKEKKDDKTAKSALPSPPLAFVT